MWLCKVKRRGKEGFAFSICETTFLEGGDSLVRVNQSSLISITSDTPPINKKN